MPERRWLIACIGKAPFAALPLTLDERRDPASLRCTVPVNDDRNERPRPGDQRDRPAAVLHYPPGGEFVFTAGEGGPVRHRNFMPRHFKPALALQTCRRCCAGATSTTRVRRSSSPTGATWRRLWS